MRVTVVLTLVGHPGVTEALLFASGDMHRARLFKSRSNKQELGSGSRTRTYDPRINSPLLYQLSYAGVL